MEEENKEIKGGKLQGKKKQKNLLLFGHTYFLDLNFVEKETKQQREKNLP